MTTIKEITIGRKFNLGNYESMEIRVTAEVKHTIDGVTTAVESPLNEAFAQLEVEIQKAKRRLENG